MLFSSLLFLYVFLPTVLLLVLLSLRKWHNGILLFASVFFYAWGGVSYSLLLVASILVNYWIGLAIGRQVENISNRKKYLILGLVINLVPLLIFKYTSFFVDNINLWLAAEQKLNLKPIVLPLGISFYTFQAISYLMDVYEKRTPVQKHLPSLALYISLFPQLIAGPIVRYHDLAKQLEKRGITWGLLASGIERFILGLAKKVILANSFAQVADDIFAVAPEDLTPLTAWTGIVLYSLQIYFDFSGYSDMAIGLGRMFGFRIPENFNFPYIASSIRDFWRRWHISLSQWFRDYLYIPLGGNRLGTSRTYFNLFLVFFLTGLWHGASWNFILWGLIHGSFMILERWGLKQQLERLGAVFTHCYVIAIILLSWVLFRSPTLPHAIAYYQALLGGHTITSEFDLAFYFTTELWLVLGLGLLASTPIFRWLHQQILYYAKNGSMLRIIYDSSTTIALLLIFLYCTMNLATNAYNPFIYFRF